MEQPPSRASTPTTYSTPSIDNSLRPTTVSYPGLSVTPKTTSLNERLNTDYVDVGDEVDSFGAQTTRAITGFVGNFITPRQLLIVLRLLKAITFCFLVLTLAADLLYIIFLEVLADNEVKELAGGRRDLIIRVYGLFFAAVAVCIELDYSVVVKSFHGFKGFIPRSLLYFFISAITGSHPLHRAEASNAADDDAVVNDDVVFDDMYGYDINAAAQIPGSAVVFQMVTSFILGLCAITYFIFGCLCLDRFTSKAFLSVNDPLVSTAIPRPGSVKASDESQTGSYRSPDP